MRNSVIGFLHNKNCLFSSIIQVGDCVAVTPYSNVLAVQRHLPQFEGSEGNFNAFSIFRQKVPEIILDEDYRLNIRNDTPDICVDVVDIYVLSVAAVLQIGSNKIIDTQNRTKNIRHLLSGKRPVAEPYDAKTGIKL